MLSIPADSLDPRARKLHIHHIYTMHCNFGAFTAQSSSKGPAPLPGATVHRACSLPGPSCSTALLPVLLCCLPQAVSEVDAARDSIRRLPLPSAGLPSFYKYICTAPSCQTNAPSLRAFCIAKLRKGGSVQSKMNEEGGAGRGQEEEGWGKGETSRWEVGGACLGDKPSLFS